MRNEPVPPNTATSTRSRITPRATSRTTSSSTPTSVRAPDESDGVIRIVVVDDHPAFLRTVAFVIEAAPGFALAGTAASGVDALDLLAARTDVDMVLLDVNLPDLSGIDVARRIEQSGATAVVVLMSTTDPADLPADAFDRGVAGFLPKERLTTASLRALWDDITT